MAAVRIRESVMDWYQAQARTIKKDLEARYGKGWSQLSNAQREALLCEATLTLLLTQAGEKYQPAQDMVRGVLKELHEIVLPV